jgi:hypothetical protein
MIAAWSDRTIHDITNLPFKFQKCVKITLCFKIDSKELSLLFTEFKKNGSFNIEILPPKVFGCGNF